MNNIHALFKQLHACTLHCGARENLPKRPPSLTNESQETLQFFSLPICPQINLISTGYIPVFLVLYLFKEVIQHFYGCKHLPLTKMFVRIENFVSLLNALCTHLAWSYLMHLCHTVNACQECLLEYFLKNMSACIEFCLKVTKWVCFIITHASKKNSSLARS